MVLEAETGAPVASDEMLDALLRRNLDLEFADRFEAELADRVVRPLPRALRGARRARHRICSPARGESVAAVRELGGRSVVVTAKYEPNAHRCLDHVGLDVDAVFGWRYADAKGDTLLDEGARSTWATRPTSN